jgi:hypothetical protein
MAQVADLHKAFITFFQPSVRVLFDWNRMARERWPVSFVFADQYPDIASWVMPWNIDTHGKEVNYAAPNARPLRLGEIVNTRISFSSQRQSSIQEYRRYLLSRPISEHVSLVIPTYHINEQTQLIMDGNHRLAAMFLENIPFYLMSFSIRGPLDRSIIPELSHWEHT